MTDEQEIRTLLRAATELPDELPPPVQHLIRLGRRRAGLAPRARAPPAPPELPPGRPPPWLPDFAPRGGLGGRGAGARRFGRGESGGIRRFYRRDPTAPLEGLGVRRSCAPVRVRTRSENDEIPPSRSSEGISS